MVVYNYRKNAIKTLTKFLGVPEVTFKESDCSSRNYIISLRRMGVGFAIAFLAPFIFIWQCRSLVLFGLNTDPPKNNPAAKFF